MESYQFSSTTNAIMTHHSSLSTPASRILTALSESNFTSRSSSPSSIKEKKEHSIRDASDEALAVTLRTKTGESQISNIFVSSKDTSSTTIPKVYSSLKRYQLSSTTRHPDPGLSASRYTPPLPSPIARLLTSLMTTYSTTIPKIAQFSQLPSTTRYQFFSTSKSSFSSKDHSSYITIYQLSPIKKYQQFSTTWNKGSSTTKGHSSLPSPAARLVTGVMIRPNTTPPNGQHFDINGVNGLTVAPSFESKPFSNDSQPTTSPSGDLHKSLPLFLTSSEEGSFLKYEPFSQQLKQTKPQSESSVSVNVIPRNQTIRSLHTTSHDSTSSHQRGRTENWSGSGQFQSKIEASRLVADGRNPSSTITYYFLKTSTRGPSNLFDGTPIITKGRKITSPDRNEQQSILESDSAGTSFDTITADKTNEPGSSAVTDASADSVILDITRQRSVIIKNKYYPYSSTTLSTMFESSSPRSTIGVFKRLSSIFSTPITQNKIGYYSRDDITTTTLSRDSIKVHSFRQRPGEALTKHDGKYFTGEIVGLVFLLIAFVLLLVGIIAIYAKIRQVRNRRYMNEVRLVRDDDNKREGCEVGPEEGLSTLYRNTSV